jgi:hypothetical protein
MHSQFAGYSIEYLPFLSSNLFHPSTVPTVAEKRITKTDSIPICLALLSPQGKNT